MTTETLTSESLLDAQTAELLPEFQKALLIRNVEKRLLALFAEGKLFGTVHTCIGQEMIGVAIAKALQDGDVIFSNHRCHGHFLALTEDVEGLIAEVMGRRSGVCGGRGGSQHLCAKGFFSNGIQGGIAPVAAGIAWASHLQGQGKVAVVFIGDGTLGEGVLYETFNIASKWRLPLLFVLENNGYAQSTPQEKTLAGDICARAEAFGIESLEADTWNPRRLLATAAHAVGCVRSGGGPFFLRVDTYRLAAHSKGDDDRDPKVLQEHWDRDPLAQFVKAHPQIADQFQEAIQARLDRALALAEAEDVAGYDNDDRQVTCQEVRWVRTRFEERARVVNRIHESLASHMASDPRIILLGEDIEGPYGGAFKVTRSLSAQFPGRVRNTPISEAALVGLGNGLALRGWRPVCEIMFGDFLALAADQIINHAAKFASMYNDKVSVPLIIRTPMGGKRGYGPTHSQSLEKHFLGLPGTQVLAIHHRFDPARVYDVLLSTVDRPSIVIENKLLYAAYASDEVPAGFVLENSDERFPTTRLRPQAAADVTIVCYGGMLADVERAVDRLFEEHEVVCEVICPVQIYPLNLGPVLESLKKTGRLLVVEEGHGFAAFGSEVVAQIQELAPTALKRSRRVYAPAAPIPACKPLELALLPGEAHVIRAVQELLQDE
jgi:2-oxoisovalerate dehydrogenase E1 component